MFELVTQRAAVLLLVLVAGCASLAPAASEDVVRQRAQGRWEALMAGDWSKAYKYMSPSYRSLVEEKRYANQFGGGAGWLTAEVVRVSCAEERCTVQMKVTFQPTIGLKPGAPATTYFDETWVREEGQWWMFQRI